MTSPEIKATSLCKSRFLSLIFIISLFYQSSLFLLIVLLLPKYIINNKLNKSNIYANLYHFCFISIFIAFNNPPIFFPIFKFTDLFLKNVIIKYLPKLFLLKLKGIYLSIYLY